MLPPSGMKPFCGVQVQPAAEPEEVLQAVAQAVPAGVEVDQLDAALDDVGAGGAEGVVDVGEQLGVDLVLGVEDARRCRRGSAAARC